MIKDRKKQNKTKKKSEKNQNDDKNENDDDMRETTLEDLTLHCYNRDCINYDITQEKTLCIYDNNKDCENEDDDKKNDQNKDDE